MPQHHNAHIWVPVLRYCCAAVLLPHAALGRGGQLDKELGAHPGDEFRKWMQKTLTDLPDNLPPVETWGELLQRMSLRPK